MISCSCLRLLNIAHWGCKKVWSSSSLTLGSLVLYKLHLKMYNQNQSWEQWWLSLDSGKLRSVFCGLFKEDAFSRSWYWSVRIAGMCFTILYSQMFVQALPAVFSDARKCSVGWRHLLSHFWSSCYYWATSAVWTVHLYCWRWNSDTAKLIFSVPLAALKLKRNLLRINLEPLRITSFKITSNL